MRVMSHTLKCSKILLRKQSSLSGVSPFRVVHMKNDFRGLIVGWVGPIYVKLKEVEKLTIRHFKGYSYGLNKSFCYCYCRFNPKNGKVLFFGLYFRLFSTI